MITKPVYDQTHERAYKRLEACLRVTAAPRAPLLVCRCGSIRFTDRVAQYWGWHAVLLEVQHLCQGCGQTIADGRMVIEEGDCLGGSG